MFVDVDDHHVEDNVDLDGEVDDGSDAPDDHNVDVNDDVDDYFRCSDVDDDVVGGHGVDHDVVNDADEDVEDAIDDEVDNF